MNLFLTGFMGSGKTSVGKLLAKKLAWPFFDTDAVIEAETGLSIPDIFAQHGEGTFRELERKLCQRLPLNHVIALGGGTYLDEQNRDTLAKQGITIFLEWPFQVLLKRILGDRNRPLARDPEVLARLYESRLETYRLADIIWQSPRPHRQLAKHVVSDLWPLLKKDGRLFAEKDREFS